MRTLRAGHGRALALALSMLALGAAVAGVMGLAGPLGRAIKEVTLPLRHEDIVRQQARLKGLDPALVAAVIFRESKFTARTSRAGAVGLMQIMPETARFIARRSGGLRFELDDLADPDINIAYGTYYLRYLRRRYHGDLLMLAAYNAGERNVDRWIERARRDGRELDDVGMIPFSETRAYVAAVLDARLEYRRKYARELGL